MESRVFFAYTFPPPPTFYFFPIFAVDMMQLTAMAALLRDSLSHHQKKITGDEGGDEGWLSDFSAFPSFPHPPSSSQPQSLHGLNSPL